MMLSPRTHDDSGHGFINPEKELNAGLWSLFAGATAFLVARIWVKVTRRHGLWYDDYILLISWVRAEFAFASSSPCPPSTPRARATAR